MQYHIPLDSNRYLDQDQPDYGVSLLEATPESIHTPTQDCGRSPPSLDRILNPNCGRLAQVVFGEPVPGQDRIEGFVRDKLIIIEAAIKQVLEEIEQREQLLKELLDDIDNQICLQKEMFFRVAPYGSSPITEGDPKRRVAIERTLASLETEKRREQASAWKDIASLKRELRELVREYNEEKRKQRVIAP